jgi:putative photosynthetic complex assembly protein
MSPLGDTINALSSKAPIREHEGEPVPGLPERLPSGETILWQGAPDPRRLGRSAFHLRGVALYFAALAALSGVGAWPDPAAVATAISLTLAIGALPLAILALMARASAATTLYTITERRIVMRVGMALPLTIQIPYGLVASASARIEADGGGDVTLTIAPPDRVSYVALWPHARPWHLGRPQPMLRGLADAATVSGILSPRARRLRRPARPGDPPRRAGPYGRARTGRGLRPEGRSGEFKDNTMASIPRPASLALIALMAASVLAAGAARIWGEPDPVPQVAANATRDLRFDDRADGAVTVRDSTGTVIAVLPPGGDGFIRGALRGLSRERRQVEAERDTPFRLTDWTDGRLTLEDRATGRSVDLRAFGATNAAAFARLLTARGEDVR